MAKQPPAPEPVPDDEAVRVVADPKRQESGERPWQGPTPESE